MSLPEILDLSQPYKPFYDPITNVQEDLNKSEIQLETVLIYIHSYSRRFQVKTILVFFFISVFLGFHEFTFVFTFLSPKFYSRQDPSTCKKNFMKPELRNFYIKLF